MSHKEGLATKRHKKHITEKFKTAEFIVRFGTLHYVLFVPFCG